MDVDRSVDDPVEVGSGVDVTIGLLADADRRRVLAVELGATAIDQVATTTGLIDSLVAEFVTNPRRRRQAPVGVGPPGGIV